MTPAVNFRQHFTQSLNPTLRKALLYGEKYALTDETITSHRACKQRVLIATACCNPFTVKQLVPSSRS
jgi:hypothetical protein